MIFEVFFFEKGGQGGKKERERGLGVFVGNTHTKQKNKYYHIFHYLF